LEIQRDELKNTLKISDQTSLPKVKELGEGLYDVFCDHFGELGATNNSVQQMKHQKVQMRATYT